MRYVRRLLALTALAVLLTSPAQADIIVKRVESGGNVVFSGGGTADLTNLIFALSNTTPAGIRPEVGIVSMNAGDFDAYSSVSGPTNFGGAGSTLATNSSGDVFGIGGNNGNLRVPDGYQSGNTLSATMTFNSATFASLGLTPGTYVWNWGVGLCRFLQAADWRIRYSRTGFTFLFAAGGLLGLILFRRRRNRAIA